MSSETCRTLKYDQVIDVIVQANVNLNSARTCVGPNKTAPVPIRIASICQFLGVFNSV